MSQALAATTSVLPGRPGTVRRGLRAAAALVRASWLTAVSYRMQMAFSLLSLLTVVVPMYFVAGALQPTMADVIAREGGQYFGFLVVGTAALLVAQAAMMAFTAAVGGGVASGTFEAMLATPAPLPSVLAGLTGYGLLWTCVRVGVLVASGALLGVAYHASALPATLLLLALLVLAYCGIGLVLAAMTLTFRTTGPLPAILLAGTSLLGGVYYPTHVIPSWLQELSFVVPMTYALRAIRRVVLDGAPFAAVVPDAVATGGFALVWIAVGAAAFDLALRHARRTGSLSRY